MPVIQAITFDLWDTLIRETPESGRKLKEARIRSLYMFLQSLEYPGTLEEVGQVILVLGDHDPLDHLPLFVAGLVSEVRHRHS